VTHIKFVFRIVI